MEAAHRLAWHWLRRDRFLFAGAVGARAAGAKGAAPRQAEQARRHAGDLAKFHAASVTAWHAADQAVGVGMHRAVQYRFGRAALDDATSVHDGDVVGEPG